MGVWVREWKGAWWVFARHRGQRKAQKIGPNKKEAKAFARKLRKAMRTDDYALPTRRVVPTFEAIAREWQERYPVTRGIGQGTIENYRSFTETHLIPHFGPMPITDVTAEAVEAFIVAKRAAGGSVKFEGRGLSKGSVTTGLIALRLILQRAVKAGHIPSNPASGVGQFIRSSSPGAAADPFTGAELRAILKAAETVGLDFAVMLRLWAQSGMRAGEVSGLQWQDLDLERGVVIVQRTWSRQRYGPTKTRVVRRVSFLHPVSSDTREWKPGATMDARGVVLGLRRLPARLDPTAPVFGTGPAPRRPVEVHRDWKRTLTLAKVRYREPEQLRHTFASTLLSRNAPLLYVQQQGGWSSAAVLLKVYSRWITQAADEAVFGADSGNPVATAEAARA